MKGFEFGKPEYISEAQHAVSIGARAKCMCFVKIVLVGTKTQGAVGKVKDEERTTVCYD